MKDKLFSFKLFFEGFKQLRVIGIMALIIYSLEAIILGFISGQANIAYEVNGFAYNVQVHSLGDSHPIILLTFVFLAPLMTLYLFYFLNKRNSSDFFHSIPKSRTSLFFSYIASIISWIIIVMVISTLISFIISLFFSDSYVINVANIFATSFNVFAASVLVVASISIAMCITGTVFTNIIVSGIIIFVPRLITTFVLYVVSSGLPMVIAGNFAPIFDLKYNVICGSIFNIFLGAYAPTAPLTALSSGIYTLVLALIYMFIALSLFKKRKSESAGLSAPNNFLQSVYRILIAFVICLIPIYILYLAFISEIKFDPEMIILTVTAYVSAIVITFIYELITTKKVKNLLRVFPSLGIVVFLNFAFVFGMFGIQQSIIHTTPDSDEISYVQFLSNPGTYLTNSDDYYFYKVGSKIKFDDEMINKLISDALKENIEKYNISNKAYNEYQQEPSYPVCVNIKHGLFSSNRVIYMGKKDYDSLMTELYSNEEYVKLYSQLPDLDSISSVSITDEFNLDEKSVNKIYETMQEELKSIDFKDALYITNYFPYNLDARSIPTLTFISATTNVGSQTYAIDLPICSLLPKTCEEYFNQINTKNLADFDEVIRIFENFNPKDEFDVMIDAENMFEDRIENLSYSSNFYWYGDTYNNIDEALSYQLYESLNIIKASRNTELSVDKLHMKIFLNYYDAKQKKYRDFNFYVAFDNEDDALFITDLIDNLNDNTQAYK